MAYNTRILIVDDNESIHEDFKKVLIHEKNEDEAVLDELESELFGVESETPAIIQAEQVSYEIDSAFQGQEAMAMVDKAAAENRPYAMVFMDVRMPPGWDGIETISRIWLRHPYIEAVLCTAYSDYTWDDIVEKLGSTDKLLFLRKPFDAVAVQQMALSLIKKWNLGEQARNYVYNLENEVHQRTLQLEQLLRELERKNIQLAEINSELKHTALHDALTGLPNRILYHDRLQHATEVATREKQQLAVALMDLNDFKAINDRHGHLAGDQVLRVISERIKAALRASDTVARLGGDEFAFVLPAVDSDSPDIVANKILAAIPDPIALPDGTTVSTSGSMGIALFPPHGENIDQLLAKADSAMYEAKRQGGGVCIHKE